MVRPWEPCEPRASTSNALYGSAAVDLQRALCKGHRDRTADGAEGLMLDAFAAYILPDLVIPEAFVPRRVPKLRRAETRAIPWT